MIELGKKKKQSSLNYCMNIVKNLKPEYVVPYAVDVASHHMMSSKVRGDRKCGFLFSERGLWEVITVVFYKREGPMLRFS